MRIVKSFVGLLSLVVLLAATSAAQTSLTSLDGGKVDLRAQKGKVVILAVGASWLPLSAKQAEYTNILSKRYSGKDVAVYFVATDSAATGSKNYASNENIAGFAAKNKLNVAVLRDSGGTVILKQYRVDQLPSFVILDKNGNQAGEAFGGIDPKFDITVPISKAVDRLL